MVTPSRARIATSQSAAHGERRSADAAAEIEGKDLAAVVAAKLQGHEREQDALARAGGADDEGVAHVADMKGKPERGASLGLAIQQGGRSEVFIPFRPRPHR